MANEIQTILAFALMAGFIYISFKASAAKKKKEESENNTSRKSFLQEILTPPEGSDEPESGLTVSRMKHSLGVARRCREIAEENGLDKDACTRLFLLGLLHDVGYETADNRKHAPEGSEILDTISFPFSQEVLLHGQPIPLSKQSEELRILNRADIETLPDGTRCTPEERLRKADKKYGQESEQYKNLEDLVGILYGKNQN